MDQSQKKSSSNARYTGGASRYRVRSRSAPHKTIDGVSPPAPTYGSTVRYGNAASGQHPVRPRPAGVTPATGRVASDTPNSSGVSRSTSESTLNHVPPASRSQPTAPSAARQPRRSSVLRRPTVQKPKQTGPDSKKSKSRRDTSNKKPVTGRPVIRLRFVFSGIGIVVGFALLGGAAAFMTSSNGNRRQQSAETEEVLASKSEMLAQIEAPEQEHVVEKPVSTDDVDSHQVPGNIPKSITIDSIDLNARIQQTTVNMDNRIQLPKNIFDVGWYEGSRKPGEQGVVLLNSYVSGANERGAFYYLRALEPGDVIELETGDSERYKYEVRHQEYFPYREMKTVSLLLPYENEENGLNLVAVDNRFNVMNNDFQDRLVVYAVQL